MVTIPRLSSAAASTSPTTLATQVGEVGAEAAALTLDDLLALLPDNDRGLIDAADLRTIVTTLWERGETIAARVASLENSGLTPAVNVSGLWQVNPTAGAVPGGMQMTSDTGDPSTATWLRFSTTDQTNTDLTAALLAATNVYGQQQNAAENWARFSVEGDTTLSEDGTYVQIPVALTGSGGTHGAAWQAATIVLRVPQQVQVPDVLER